MSGKPCPVPGCGRRAKAGHLMCAPCWREVPKDKQTAVYATWRKVQRQSSTDRAAWGEALKAYREAAAAAIKAVEETRP